MRRSQGLLGQGALWVLFVVMFLLLAAAHGAVTFPVPQGFVTDTANVIPDEIARRIGARLEELRAKTGAEVAVMTVPSISPLSVEEYATGLFARWGIGQKAKDNGVLILLALKERKVRIETGYGIEPILPDGKAGAIIREVMLPRFKQGALGEGLAAGAEAVAEIIAQAEGVTLSGSRAVRPVAERSPPPNIVGPLILIAFLALFWVLPIWLGRSRRRGLFWGGMPLVWGGGYGSGFGGGGFSGGFGGFGGGGSGGGGASGGW